jgi:hypothetical protein
MQTTNYFTKQRKCFYLFIYYASKTRKFETVLFSSFLKKKKQKIKIRNDQEMTPGPLQTTGIH